MTIEFVVLAVAVVYRANFEDLSPTIRVSMNIVCVILH